MKQFSIDITGFVWYNHIVMKYKFYFTLRKSILFLLAVFVSFSLFACGGEEISEDPGSESSDPQAPDIGTLAGLLEKDREVIEMFVCNSLCESKDIASVQKVSAQSSYARFSEVESLLNRTYSVSGGSADYFLSYPSFGEKAVSDENGATCAFYHAGSGFTDFADTSTISLYPSESTDECGFSVRTASGRTAGMKAIRVDDGWVLENSLFRVLAGDPEKPDKKFPLSGIGSFSEFDGNILFIELFFSDKSSKFTSDEENEFHSAIESAVSYLSAEAERYGREVSVTYERAYFDHQGVLGTHEMSFDIMFAETGFGTLEAFAEHNYDLSEYDNYVFAVCYNKEQPTAHNTYNPDSENHESPELYYAERVFVGSGSTDAEICKALLSMLGAGSVYSEDSDEYLSGLYRSYFPNDVLVSRDLNGTSLSPVAAYACGMTDELDPLLRPFVDQ